MHTTHKNKLLFIFAIFFFQTNAFESFQSISVSIPTKVNQIGPWFGLDVGGNITISQINSTDGSLPPKNPPTWSNLYLVLFSRDQWVCAFIALWYEPILTIKLWPARLRYPKLFTQLRWHAFMSNRRSDVRTSLFSSVRQGIAFQKCSQLPAIQ